MAKFTKADDITVPQSLKYTDGNYGTFGTGSEFLQVFKPHQGFDLLYKNPNTNQGSTEITEELDDRFKLGTYTLNNRDLWENNNFNESNLQSYLKDDLEVIASITVNTPDGEVVRIADDNVYDNSDQPYLWSIDALPFVINPNNDDIIHVDRYYDRDINKEEYELATEGKINYYLEPRSSGRGAYNNNATGDNIDIFSTRGKRTKGLGQNYFDYLIKTSINDDSDTNDENGFYLFKLNWGDGSEIEYTSKPQLLESTILLEHFYDNPGFYTISGLVYQLGTNLIRAWEKFETNILLNPSPNYKLKLFDYNNFASIGGISKDSAFVKSLYNLVGINPLTQVNDRASEDIIKNLNLMDKLQILNTLGKVDYSLIQPYWNLLAPYQTPTDDVDSFVFGCMSEDAANYNEDANIDDGTCLFVHDVTLLIDGEPPIPITLQIAGTTVEVSESITIPRGMNELKMLTDQGETEPTEEGVDGGLSYYDYTFNGWFNEDNDLITTNADGIANVNVLANRTLTAKFTYQDITRPEPVEDLEIYNYEQFFQPSRPAQTTLPLDSITVFFDDPDSAEGSFEYNDINYFKITRFYYDYILEEQIEEEITQIPFGTEQEIVRFPNGLNFNRYKYIDENLPYREYTYQLQTVDLSGLVSDLKTTSPLYPTPNDTTPQAIPNESLSLIQSDFRRLTFSWQRISEAWPGLEGNFKHFKIEVDGPNADDYVYQYLGNYTGDESQGLIPNTSEIYYPNGLVQKGFIIPLGGATDIGVGDEVNINNLPILPWKFKISVVGDTSENDESSATEFIEITPQNWIGANINTIGTIDTYQQIGNFIDGVNTELNSNIKIPINILTFLSEAYPGDGSFNSSDDNNTYLKVFTKDLSNLLPLNTYYGYEINFIGESFSINYEPVEQEFLDFERFIGSPSDILSLMNRNIYVGVFDSNDKNLIAETEAFQINEINGCGNPNADNYNIAANAGDMEGYGDYCTFSYKLLLENIIEDEGLQGTIEAISMEFDEDYDTGELDYSKGYFKDGEIEGDGYGGVEVQYEQIQIEDYEFILIAANDLGQNGIFKRWEIEDNQNGLLFTDQVSFGNDSVLNINANSFTNNINDLDFLQNGGSPFSYLAVRPANTASPTNYEDKTIRVVWGESGLEYNEEVAEGQLGQDLNLANHANPDEDDNDYGTDEYPNSPQPVEVYGAPYTGESGYENQSSLGFVGPTNFILMDNVVEYTEPGHPFEGSEIELSTRIIEARPNEEFESDDDSGQNVTYTQSFVRWEIKQGANYIDKIYNDEHNNIILENNFINVSTYGESVKTITIEYSSTDFDSETPIIIEGYFLQEGSDGSSGGGKQP